MHCDMLKIQDGVGIVEKLNSTPLFFHSSHFNCNNDKFNPLPRVLKENINKIYKMQHFTTLGNAAYKFFKTFRANPAWVMCVAVTGGVEYFHEDRQHTCTISFPQRLCAVYLRKIFNPPCHGRRTLATRGVSTGCFEKLVSSISNGGKMPHFVYFVYIFF